MAKRPALIYGLAFAVSLVTLGHPNPFTIGPDIDAILCSFVASLIAFGFTVRGAKKRWPQES